MKTEFSIDQAYKSSWTNFKSNPFYIIGFFIALIAISLILYAITGSLGGGRGSNFSLISQILSWIVGTVIQIAALTFLLNLYRDKKEAILERVKDVNLIFKLLAANFLAGIIILVGLILLIIPGIIFALRLKFVSYYVVDKKAGPIEAISLSWNLTQGNVTKLFLLSLLNLLVNIIGLLLLIVGLLVTAPLTQMVDAKVYLLLTEKK